MPMAINSPLRNQTPPCSGNPTLILKNFQPHRDLRYLKIQQAPLELGGAHYGTCQTAGRVQKDIEKLHQGFNMASRFDTVSKWLRHSFDTKLKLTATRLQHDLNKTFHTTSTYLRALIELRKRFYTASRQLRHGFQTASSWLHHQHSFETALKSFDMTSSFDTA